MIKSSSVIDVFEYINDLGVDSICEYLTIYMDEYERSIVLDDIRGKYGYDTLTIICYETIMEININGFYVCDIKTLEELTIFLKQRYKRE